MSERSWTCPSAFSHANKCLFRKLADGGLAGALRNEAAKMFMGHADKVGMCPGIGSNLLIVVVLFLLGAPFLWLLNRSAFLLFRIARRVIGSTFLVRLQQVELHLQRLDLCLLLQQNSILTRAGQIVL